MSDAPLQFLSRLVGGSWHYLPPAGDSSGLTMRHSFHWQIEGYALTSQSVSPSGASTGSWYWHPTAEEVRMFSLGKALGGLSLAEYRHVRMEGDSLVCELTTHDADGSKHYREEYHFLDEDHYNWTLFALSDEGEQQVMTASFERRDD